MLKLNYCSVFFQGTSCSNTSSFHFTRSLLSEIGGWVCVFKSENWLTGSGSFWHWSYHHWHCFIDHPGTSLDPTICKKELLINYVMQIGEGGGLPWCYARVHVVECKDVVQGREEVKKTRIMPRNFYA